MAFEITAKEGSPLFLAAALRGASNNGAAGYVDRIKLAQSAADRYAAVLNEVTQILAEALVKDASGELDPVTLARDAAATIEALKDSVRYYSGGTAIS